MFGEVVDPVVLGAAQTPRGESLAALSRESPVLLVFLRHFGCTFGRQTLREIAACRRDLEAAGTRVAFAHTALEEEAEPILTLFGLEDVPRFSDPHGILFSAFGLAHGGPLALFGPRVLWRGVQGLLAGHGLGKVKGDPWMMPGAFLLHDSRVLKAFRPPTIADRPDYRSLAKLP